MTTLTAITIPTADILDRLGPDGEHWIQGSWTDNGGMCLHQGIRVCMPQSGDPYLIEQVSAGQGWGTGFNDAEDTSWADIVGVLDTHPVITEEELAEVFGPNWGLVRVVVDQAAALTPDQVKQLNAAGAAAGAAAWDAAGAAAGAAAWAAAWAAAGAAAGAAAWAAAGAAAWAAAGAAARAAAGAVVVKDLIGEHGFTQAHYNTLTGPWRTVFGGFDD